MKWIVFSQLVQFQDPSFLNETKERMVVLLSLCLSRSLVSLIASFETVGVCGLESLWFLSQEKRSFPLKLMLYRGSQSEMRFMQSPCTGRANPSLMCSNKRINLIGPFFLDLSLTFVFEEVQESKSVIL